MPHASSHGREGVRAIIYNYLLSSTPLPLKAKWGKSG
jgi:hypothetical protein